jgi:hypothetical protein
VRIKLQYLGPKVAGQTRYEARPPMQAIAGVDGDRGLRAVGGWANAH